MLYSCQAVCLRIRTDNFQFTAMHRHMHCQAAVASLKLSTSATLVLACGTGRHVTQSLYFATEVNELISLHNIWHAGYRILVLDRMWREETGTPPT